MESVSRESEDRDATSGFSALSLYSSSTPRRDMKSELKAWKVAKEAQMRAKAVELPQNKRPISPLHRVGPRLGGGAVGSNGCYAAQSAGALVSSRRKSTDKPPPTQQPTAVTAAPPSKRLVVGPRHVSPLPLARSARDPRSSLRGADSVPAPGAPRRHPTPPRCREGGAASEELRPLSARIQRDVADPGTAATAPVLQRATRHSTPQRSRLSGASEASTEDHPPKPGGVMQRKRLCAPTASSSAEGGSHGGHASHSGNEPGRCGSTPTVRPPPGGAYRGGSNAGIGSYSAAAAARAAAAAAAASVAVALAAVPASGRGQQTLQHNLSQPALPVAATVSVAVPAVRLVSPPPPTPLAAVEMLARGAISPPRAATVRSPKRPPRSAPTTPNAPAAPHIGHGHGVEGVKTPSRERKQTVLSKPLEMTPSESMTTADAILAPEAKAESVLAGPQSSAQALPQQESQTHVPQLPGSPSSRHSATVPSLPSPSPPRTPPAEIVAEAVELYQDTATLPLTPPPSPVFAVHLCYAPGEREGAVAAALTEALREAFEIQDAAGDVPSNMFRRNSAAESSAADAGRRGGSIVSQPISEAPIARVSASAAGARTTGPAQGVAAPFYAAVACVPVSSTMDSVAESCSADIPLMQTQDNGTSRFSPPSGVARPSLDKRHSSSEFPPSPESTTLGASPSPAVKMTSASFAPPARGSSIATATMVSSAAAAIATGSSSNKRVADAPLIPEMTVASHQIGVTQRKLHAEERTTPRVVAAAATAETGRIPPSSVHGDPHGSPNKQSVWLSWPEEGVTAVGPSQSPLSVSSPGPVSPLSMLSLESSPQQFMEQRADGRGYTLENVDADVAPPVSSLHGPQSDTSTAGALRASATDAVVASVAAAVSALALSPPATRLGDADAAHAASGPTA
eukprot:TRINITY_DN49141_c0_g1_i1.p1 TRINITY_DN49141_c0_g1~~TRINITY_DN49141_c0_g1_i1.p1  ORF type:complete len:913 (-),score=167.80 TRINITY_DN49141_c0_g1_i1:188-2926(-)